MTPTCETCQGVTEPIIIDNPDAPQPLQLTNAGFCVGCSTLIVQGKGTVIYVLARGETVHNVLLEVAS